MHAQSCLTFCNPRTAAQVAPVVLKKKKNPPANAGDVRDVGLIPGSGRSPGEGNGNPLQYSCLENPMERGAWWATVHRVTKSRTRLKWLSTTLDCSPPGSSVHGIFQARILDWVAISYARESSWPRDGTHVSCVCCTGWQILFYWAVLPFLKLLNGIHNRPALPIEAEPITIFLAHLLKLFSMSQDSIWIKQLNRNFVFKMCKDG